MAYRDPAFWFASILCGTIGGALRDAMYWFRD